MFNFPGQSQIIIILFETVFHVFQVGLKLTVLAKEKPELLFSWLHLGITDLREHASLLCASNGVKASPVVSHIFQPPRLFS